MYKEINLPMDTKLDVSSYLKIVRVSNFKDISSFKNSIDNTIKFYGKNTKRLYFYLEDLEILKTLYNLKYKNMFMLFDVNTKNISLVKEYKEILGSFYTKALLDSIIKPSEVVDIVKFLAKYNIRSEISYDLFKKLDSKNFENITKELLLDKKYVKYVEPFFSFANYVYEKNIKKSSKHTLWEIFKDELNGFLYINKDSDVAVSKRWDKRGKYLYNLDDKEQSIKKSPLYQELKSYDENLFFENLECAMCDKYELCKAYLKFENKEYDCSGFKSMIEEIEKNFEIFKKASCQSVKEAV